jgi:hypothetical protein
LERRQEGRVDCLLADNCEGRRYEMFDRVGTKEKHGFDHATSEAFDMFQPVNKM